ncbi:hypothetical protein ALP75_204669 [Pseudomonas syringae pv. actinidiae]|nr:hypothetical protein ALP75_204669 [Pseudomonas syringae pv. actinidiae]
MSTAPREPKNGQMKASTIRAARPQRWVFGWVRKSLVFCGISGLSEPRRMVLICSVNSTRRNSSTEHTAMMVRVSGLAFCTCRVTPENASFRPNTG